MNGYDTSDEHRPLTYINGYPIYAAHFVVVVYVASMLVCTLLKAFGQEALLSLAVFTSADVLRGQVWRLVSYGLVNLPSLNFVIEMFMIAWFGREVERFLGRKTFFALYACLYLITPLLLTALGLRFFGVLAGATGGFALFIAFAALYPNAPIFFNILAKWLALILVGIYSLIALSNHDWTGLLTLWATTGFAYAFIRYHQGRFSLPKVPSFRRGPKLRVLPDPVEVPAGAKASRNESMAEVDALLDKIAQSGIGSLTAKERAKLDAAQADILRKKSGRR